jgi:hypothetical protein
LAKFPPHAKICSKLATRKADCIPLWEATQFKPSIAISLNLQAIQVRIIQKQKMSYSVNSILKKIIQKLYKNGSDLRTFNLFPSVPTIFYVQRKGDFSIKNVPIPYENSVTNTGGAMDEKREYSQHHAMECISLALVELARLTAMIIWMCL